jgi:hypothetical protein
MQKMIGSGDSIFSIYSIDSMYSININGGSPQF